MGPELFSAELDYSVSVDIWALGVIFHNMLFGDFPFIADTPF